MRSLVIAAAIAIPVAIALADVAAPAVVEVDRGNYGFDPQVSDLRQLPPDENCADQLEADRACPLRLAFRPGATFTVWISVRNSGPLPITLDGVAPNWFDVDPASAFLGWPNALFDGGDPVRSVPILPEAPAPFQPLTLSPGAQRTIGINFQLRADIATACEMWEGGSGMGWDSIPFQWHWLLIRHEANVELVEPVTIVAPTSAECSV